MKRFVFVILFFLSACTPKPEQISPYVDQTLTAYPTRTSYPTNTAFPTYTPFPTYTKVPTYTPIIKNRYTDAYSCADFHEDTYTNKHS